MLAALDWQSVTIIFSQVFNLLARRQRVNFQSVHVLMSRTETLLEDHTSLSFLGALRFTPAAFNVDDQLSTMIIWQAASSELEFDTTFATVGLL